MAISYSIFISSVQKELAEERREVKNFILNDPLLRRFVRDVFLFEDIPAQDRKSDDIYLSEVKKRDIYIGILGNKYGWKNADGKSPTELEFEHATKTHRERLVFVKGLDDFTREPEMAALVRKSESQLTRRRFEDIPGLNREVYASLVEFLEKNGALRTSPFDDTVCSGATLDDIDEKKIAYFLDMAEAKGRLTIKGSKGSPGDAETQTAHKGLKGLIPDRDEAEKTGNTQGAISGKATQETTQERILACLIDSPTLTRRTLASNIGITEDGIKYHLTKLTKAKLIRHIGSTKTGHWEILK